MPSLLTWLPQCLKLPQLMVVALELVDGTSSLGPSSAPAPTLVPIGGAGSVTSPGAVFLAQGGDPAFGKANVSSTDHHS